MMLKWTGPKREEKMKTTHGEFPKFALLCVMNTEAGDDDWNVLVVDNKPAAYQASSTELLRLDYCDVFHVKIQI